MLAGSLLREATADELLCRQSCSGVTAGCPCVQALKILLATVKHFDDFVEDQFDFHAYCVRKMTLRAYVQMLRMEDCIHENIFYSKVSTLQFPSPVEDRCL